MVKLGPGTITESVWKKTGKALPEHAPALAMIDTGAASTIIKASILDKLGLPPVDQVRIHTPTSSNIDCFRYWVRLYFPQDVCLEATAIAAPLEGQHIQCLIGRDALRHCLMIYNGPDQSYTLGF